MRKIKHVFCLMIHCLGSVELAMEQPLWKCLLWTCCQCVERQHQLLYWFVTVQIIWEMGERKMQIHYIVLQQQSWQVWSIRIIYWLLLVWWDSKCSKCWSYPLCKIYKDHVFSWRGTCAKTTFWDFAKIHQIQVSEKICIEPFDEYLTFSQRLVLKTCRLYELCLLRSIRILLFICQTLNRLSMLMMMAFNFSGAAVEGIPSTEILTSQE